MQILITTAPYKKSKKIKLALKENLASCILEINSNSSFIWRGKIEKEKEKIFVFKTTDEKIEKLKDFIEKNHPYEIPFIATFKLNKVNEKYLKWLGDI